MQEIWLLQPRLGRRKGGRKGRISIMNNPRFRAGFDFLQLRAIAGEPVQGEVDAWQQFLNSEPSSPKPQYHDSTPEAKNNANRLKRRRRRKPRDTDHPETYSE
jgi:poly(A) polymerase